MTNSAYCYCSCSRSLRPGRFVNQFGCENVLTCKDLLVDTAKRVRHSGASPQDPSQKVGVVEWTGPNWLPETYNLLYELPHLVLHYRLMEKRYPEVFLFCNN